MDDDVKKNENLNRESIESEAEPEAIFNRKSIKSYIKTFFLIIGIIGIIYIISMMFHIPLISVGSNKGGIPPAGDSNNTAPPPPNRPAIFSQVSIWPIWGTFSLPSPLAIFIFIALCCSMYFWVKKSNFSPKTCSIMVIIIIGISLIFLTNLMQGWEKGIGGSIAEDIAQGSTLFHDALKINDLSEFIGDYQNFQSSLGVHSRTHPPGAVLSIYLLYLLFGSTAGIAIGLCVFSSIFSVLFLNGIYKRYFGIDMTKYMLILFILLPAVQIYYLANFYAIITTILLGVLYCYLHDNRLIRWFGSTSLLFLATFVSFMSWFIILALFFFEIMRVFRKWKIEGSNDIVNWIKMTVLGLKNWIIIAIAIIGIYSLLLVGTGFNYISSFMVAANAESGEGFELLVNPANYLITRIADILDIMIFFGPILLVLCYRGIKILNSQSWNKERLEEIHLLIISATTALLLIFLTGAYDHGETARAAMYIYPFLLLPVAIYLEYNEISIQERKLLVAVVFFQSLIMQLVGSYVW